MCYTTRLALREEFLTTFLILLLHFSFYGLLCVPFFGELKLHLYKTHQIQRRKSTAVMALHLSKCWTVCCRVVPFIGPCHASPIRPAQPDSPLIDWSFLRLCGCINFWAKWNMLRDLMIKFKFSYVLSNSVISDRAGLAHWLTGSISAYNSSESSRCSKASKCAHQCQ